MISWQELKEQVPELEGILPWDDANSVNSLGLDIPPEKCRVVVAMSGGVDSTVVAALLKAQGYDVVGITLQLYDHGRAVSKVGACCGTSDVIDSRISAEILDIPYYVLDYKQSFHDSVINPFAETYINGETPVPCTLCNKTVKFDQLLHQAKKIEANLLATGHYVRSFQQQDKSWALHKGIDPERDQSWFLYQLTQPQLDFTRFPIGGYLKSTTRKIAEAVGLNIAEKPDSQDICFVPKGNYSEIIARLNVQANKPGKIVHIDGRELGKHDGIFKFTVGQRKGLGVAVGEPLFVIKLIAQNSTVIVGPREALDQQEVYLKNVHWIDAKIEAAIANGLSSLSLQVRMRSSEENSHGVFENLGFALRRDSDVGYEAKVVLQNPRSAVSPGQSCVFYDADTGDKILGGATIVAQPSLAQSSEIQPSEVQASAEINSSLTSEFINSGADKILANEPQ